MAFYFRDRFSVVMCITLSGSRIGTIIYGPMTQVFLDAYGWRGAMLLLSGLAFNMVWAGALMQKPREAYQAIPHECVSTDGGGAGDGKCDGDAADDSSDVTTGDGEDVPSDETLKGQDEKTRCGSTTILMRSIGLDILLNTEFVLLACMRMLCNASYNGFVVYMVPAALAAGQSPQMASFLATAFGLGSLAGLVLGAALMHRRPGASDTVPLVVAIAVSLIAALLFAVDPLITGSGLGQQVVTSFIGAMLACLILIVAVRTRSLPFGDDSVGVVYGWMAALSGLGAASIDSFLGQ